MKFLIPAAMLGVALVVLSGCGQGGADPVAGDPAADPNDNGANPAPMIPINPVNPAAPAEPPLATRIQKSRTEMQATLSRAGKTQQIATVVVKGVPGDPEDAARFLYGIVSKAAGAVANEDHKRAREQTRQNKQQAEAAQRQKFLEGTGGLLYEYRIAEDQYGYAYTWNVGREGNTFAFVTHPAPDLAAFGKQLQRLGPVVSTDGTNREIVIQANIPTPIPDLAIEGAIEQHGPVGYAVIEIRNAPGNEEDVQYFLEQQLKQIKGADDAQLTVAYLKRLSSDGYRFLVYPVDSKLESLTEQISCGEVVGAIEASRTLLVTGALPALVPKKPSREELWALAEEERKNRKSAWDEEPKKGETIADWAIRILKDGTHTSREAVYKSLARDEVDDARRADVTAALVECIKNDPWIKDNPDFTPAVERWKSDDLEVLITEKLNDDEWKRHRAAIIMMLEACGTETAAKAIATCLTDFFVKDDAFAALKRMGPAAEPVFIEYLEHNDLATRLTSAQLLGQFGGERSLKALEKLLRNERSKEVKAAARFSIERIKERVAEEPAETGTRD